MLELSAKRARIPVLVDSPIAGAPLVISVLDSRIPVAKARAFTTALRGSLEQAAVRKWVSQLRSLAERLQAPTGDDDELAALIEAWRIWPERESDPARQVPELAAGLRAETNDRSARAALIIYRFARGELLAALTDWAALPKPSATPSFAELQLDALALGLLGRRSDAMQALSQAESIASDPEAWLAIARAYEALEQQDAAIAAHQRVIASRGDAWDRLRLARVRGGFAANEPVPGPEPGASFAANVSLVREVVKIHDAAGHYDDTLTAIAELLDANPDSPPPSELVLRAAELHLWRNEGARARARLAALPDRETHPRARLIEGALTILEGQPQAGLDLLESIETSSPARLELLLWKAEAQLALGQPKQALDCIDEHIIRENSLVAYLLKLFVLLESEPAETLSSTLGSRTFLDGLVRDVLPTLCAPERIDAVREDPAEFAALIRELLDDMGGNRGPNPTWCRRIGGQAARLERIEVRRSGREAAVDNLIQIRNQPADAVLAGFEAVMAEYPTSPHPYTYRGELLIWLGRYEDALASFDEADARAPTRWSYVGRAAVYDLIGESDKADHWTRVGIAQFGELQTATSHVYRGERLRKLRAWPEAQRDLEVALEHKVRRIGARINLTLVYSALGENHAADRDRQLERLQIDAPAFLWEVGARAGREIDESMLLAMLDLMVGNRSSFLHTMIDADGEFRVIPEPGRWIGSARLSVALGRRELERMIVARSQA